MTRAEIVCDRDGSYVGLSFDCPGCPAGGHMLKTDWTPAGRERAKDADVGPKWHFNGDTQKPTLSPSVLSRYQWGPDQAPVVCHSFIREGRIEFLRDCTHSLAGKTVDLPEIQP